MSLGLLIHMKCLTRHSLAIHMTISLNIHIKYLLIYLRHILRYSKAEPFEFLKLNTASLTNTFKTWHLTNTK